MLVIHNAEVVAPLTSKWTLRIREENEKTLLKITLCFQARSKVSRR